MTVPPLCKVIISIVGKRKTVCYNVRRKRAGETADGSEMEKRLKMRSRGYP